AESHDRRSLAGAGRASGNRLRGGQRDDRRQQANDCASAHRNSMAGEKGKGKEVSCRAKENLPLPTASVIPNLRIAGPSPLSDVRKLLRRGRRLTNSLAGPATPASIPPGISASAACLNRIHGGAGSSPSARGLT